jgi:2-methylisocitrate lyase-like PEP mutase family enzyme
MKDNYRIRELKKDSAADKFLYHINAANKPVIAPDVSDAFTAIALQKNQDLFNAYWLSSLGISSRLGFPDAYTLSPRDLIQLITDIKNVSEDKFLIADADNAGQSYKNTKYAFELYATLGVSLAIVENKRGVKFNSVDKTAGKMHSLEDREIFAEKINYAINAQNSTLVGIRLEDGIVNDDDEDLAIKETLDSVVYFTEKSKPDLFLFHWKKEDPNAVLKFAEEYNKLFENTRRPLLACVPTTYSHNVTNSELYKAGYQIIIYGNALLRSQLMGINLLIDSLKNEDSLKELHKKVPPVEDIFEIVGK